MYDNLGCAAWASGVLWRMGLQGWLSGKIPYSTTPGGKIATTALLYDPHRMAILGDPSLWTERVAVGVPHVCMPSKGSATIDDCRWHRCTSQYSVGFGNSQLGGSFGGALAWEGTRKRIETPLFGGSTGTGGGGGSACFVGGCGFGGVGAGGVAAAVGGGLAAATAPGPDMSVSGSSGW
eukprot:CAMPEP_0181216186 /NCGR_PEP_ID=MMETSP1096-20121128/26435_1 /TAXON_ID=156174 ORGANISM="Chrysochromulina ericina, Strain CCMP281" /NCGR_SAMPLE_ID=MMETSP1096 /ASSEMBLY_ACC=CAM_ASM_000453 /LENGTH=178 /DNA_ID=CAMNT_0023308137 /DNA_START=350 /DNA_END=886 /DNA_ORIENTATION=+